MDRPTDRQKFDGGKNGRADDTDHDNTLSPYWTKCVIYDYVFKLSHKVLAHTV